MTTEPTPFLFEGEHLVRVIDQSGDPWFVAKDAAHLLGYRDAEKITRLLDDDEKGTLKMGTLGGEQEVSIISEPGLYKAIARSSKPQAKRVDRWIRHEVLPSIRRTGSYTAPKAKRKAADPDSEKIRAQKAYITQLNATTRAMREIRLTLGIREAAKAAPALVKPLGITIDPNNADCFRQGDLDFPPGGGNA